VVKVKTRASEAKGPFPGGKRVGSWGKIKGRDPPSAVGGLEGIEKRVGSWGKKVKVKAHGLRSMGLLFLIDEKEKGDPPSAVGGLEAIVDGVRLFERYFSN
jgi:hypothetical protein